MQKTVALSTSEAEYMAMGESVKELLFVRNVLYFMQPKHGVPSVYGLEDNCGAIDLVQKPLSSERRTNHIEVRHHIVVAKGEIGIFHVASENQVSDIFTK
ncbi:unnamed protein product, partial [Discosporangium mesarthrocarpum]